MRLLGILILLFGIIDFAGRYLGYSIWNDYLGISLAPFLQNYGPYVEMALGAGLMIANQKRDI